MASKTSQYAFWEQMYMDITVCIPSIPPRASFLARALRSVSTQLLPARAIAIAYDTTHDGAAVTRQRALDTVTTDWVAFLDDDDEFLPGHLQTLSQAVLEHDADYAFSWYTVIGGTDPRPEEFGQPWDPEHPRQTTITTLVRTSLAKSTGFLPDEVDDLHSPDRHYAGEDWRFTSRCANAGAKIIHVPERTWRWYHHDSNTSGLPRW